jgi:hypothetical protein
MAEGNELLALFERYNPDVWPLPIVGYVTAAIALALIALRPGGTTDRLVTAMLALAWLWLGVVFQGIYVREANAVLGVVGAVVFISGAVLLLRAGIVRTDLRFRFVAEPMPILGAAALAYAIVVYPLIGIFLGHGYPHAPLLGAAPCPTTIATFGLLLIARPPLPAHLLVMPVVWAILGPLGAVPQGVVEDLALFVVGVGASILILLRDRRWRPHEDPGADRPDAVLAEAPRFMGGTH